MHKRPAFGLTLEPLESRALLSTTHAHAATAQVLKLTATVQASFVAMPHQPGFVTPYQITGSANLPVLGKTSLIALINAPGEEFTLKTSRGTIKFSPLAHAYSLSRTITYEYGFGAIQGTGAYQTETGVGFIDVTLSSPTAAKGRVTITIDSHAFGAAVASRRAK